MDIPKGTIELTFFSEDLEKLQEQVVNWMCQNCSPKACATFINYIGEDGDEFLRTTCLEYQKIRDEENASGLGEA